MLSAIMLSVVMLIVIISSVIMLSVIMLSVIMLSVIMKCFIMLSVITIKVATSVNLLSSRLLTFAARLSLVDTPDDDVTHVRPHPRQHHAEIAGIVERLVAVASVIAKFKASSAVEKLADGLHLHRQTAE
jgi:hypothetical protein